MLGKNTILKAIHNKKCYPECSYMVWMLGKNTILKAIHNEIKVSDKYQAGVNAG